VATASGCRVLLCDALHNTPIKPFVHGLEVVSW
jgi:hypothetical protein